MVASSPAEHIQLAYPSVGLTLPSGYERLGHPSTGLGVQSKVPE
jgi:hypothetical protein